MLAILEYRKIHTLPLTYRDLGVKEAEALASSRGWICGEGRGFWAKRAEDGGLR